MLSGMTKAVPIIIAAGLAVGAVAQTQKYEAEDAERTNGGTVVALSSVSGGSYVKMEGGNLSFSVNIPVAGDYVVWINYSHTYGEPGSIKKQDIYVNGASLGEATFARTRDGAEGDPPEFKREKIVNKVKFGAGANTFDIRNSWGWVDIDYIEVGPYEAEPFNLSANLVTPNASANARKIYDFMRANFQKKIISGVMVGYALTTHLGAHNLATLAETKHVFDQSGKYPALLGLDFFHGTGYKSDDMWYIGENSATLSLAEELFSQGGIPHFMWHWKDPGKILDAGESEDKLFYSNTHSGYPQGTSFDLSKAFTNTSHTAWDTNSDEYKGILEDIDRVSGYLKTLADKDIAVLWRPLHEASGGWFWWGARGAQAAKSLWKLMFDRMVDYHGLDNLIWVWTCEEGENALEWYPGDEYVDIIGRDYYYWPNADNRQEYGSLSLNFENLKETYNAKKIIALSEQGTVPDPDSLVADGAGWSFFMSWNENFLRVANPDAHWQKVMNHEYVLTLDEMPGWDVYASVFKGGNNAVRGSAVRAPSAAVNGKTLRITSPDNSGLRIRMINVQGRTVKTFKSKGSANLPLKNIPAGRYVVEIKKSGKRVNTNAVTVR